MMFPALLILLVSFCQGAPNPPTESDPYQPPDKPVTASFMCLGSTVLFKTDPKEVSPLLLSGLCNAAGKAIEKLTSACLGINGRYRQEKAACKAARAHKLHLEMMVTDADQDTMESKEGNFDARLNPRLSLYEQLQISTKLAEMTCRKAEELQFRRDKCVGKCNKDKKAAGLKAGFIIDDILNLKKLVRSQRWFWFRRTKQLYRNRYWLTPQVRPKTVKQRHSFALMETLRTCGDSASLQKYVTRQFLDTSGFFKDPSFDQSRAHGTRYLMLARMDALWTARKAIQIGILVDTHPFSVDHCISMRPATTQHIHLLISWWSVNK
ncbi:hypothetical protein BASA50_001955 [Batrachochytrium salamandrivorans]|uniref:Uncharacterized protein n=1 Tax=Batrachochytrium salamandrivorans TaxID=1357716 RepID=A0ABQ8FMN7_9FUNG|nr:hypothetical protein BASA50_001955 [Batrachochytrium salamandrivorans]